MTLEISGLFALGLVTGVVGGFLGIGGGVIVTAVLLEWFTAKGIPVETRFQLAFGTTLLAIFGTAISATATYARMRRVLWPLVWPIAGAALVTSLLGSRLAALSPGAVLKTLFVVFCLVNAYLLLRGKPQAYDGAMRPHTGRLLAIGALTGLVSAYLGVAGGVVMVPLLLLWIRVRGENAPGTSSAVGIVTSLAGAAGYMWYGTGAAQLPPDTWGFVVPSIAFPILLGTLAGAPLGSLLNRRWGRVSFRYAFAVFLLLMAARIYFKN